MGFDLSTAAQNTAENAANGVIGMVLGGINDRRQLKQQDKLYGLQYKYNEMAAGANYQRQMDLWNATNYEAQVDHLKNAGLNPALLYGKGGGGGATAAASGGNSGVGTANAPAGGREIMELSQMTMQREMMNAQIELAKSQANKNNVEAKKTAGVDTQQTIAQTRSLTQGIENQKAQQYLTQAQTYLTNMQGIVANRTLDDSIDYIHWNAKRALAELGNAENETYINTTTRNEKIKIIQQEAIKGVLTNILTKAQTEATKQGITESKAKVEQMAATISQGWQQLSVNEGKLAVDKFRAEIDANYPGIWNVVGKAADYTLEDLFSRTHNGTKHERTNSIEPQKQTKPQ